MISLPDAQRKGGWLQSTFPVSNNEGLCFFILRNLFSLSTFWFPQKNLNKQIRLFFHLNDCSPKSFTEKLVLIFKNEVLFSFPHVCKIHRNFHVVLWTNRLKWGEEEELNCYYLGSNWHIRYVHSVLVLALWISAAVTLATACGLFEETVKPFQEMPFILFMCNTFNLIKVIK